MLNVDPEPGLTPSREPSMRTATIFWLTMTVTFAATGLRAQSLPSQWQQVAHDVLRDLVNVNTAAGGQGTTRAADIIMARLRSAGFAAADMVLAGPDPANQNLVVRLRGAQGARPL